MRKILLLLSILFYSNLQSQKTSRGSNNDLNILEVVRTVANKGAKLKSEPSINPSKMERLEKNTEVVVRKASGNYFHVCIENRCGYIHEVFLEVTPEMEEMKLNEIDRYNEKLISNNPDFFKTKTLPGSNLKLEPNINSTILHKSKGITEVVVKGYIDNYFEVCYGGRCGYMHEMFITKNAETEKLRLKSIEEQNQKNILKREEQLRKMNSEENLYMDLSSTTKVSKHPSFRSSELQNFKKDNVKVIGYLDNFYKVKSEEGEFGYIYGVPQENESNINYLLNKQIEESIKSHQENILIRGAAVAGINSANGVDIEINWMFLNSDKTIKYIRFIIVPFNNVGDIQMSEIGSKVRASLEITGPIVADTTLHGILWESVWYNPTITCIKINKVEVEYMDGSSYTYIKELPKIIHPYISNICR